MLAMALVLKLLIWVCWLYINAGPLPYYFGFESLTVHVSISILSCTCIFLLTFAIWFLKWSMEFIISLNEIKISLRTNHHSLNVFFILGWELYTLFVNFPGWFGGWFCISMEVSPAKCGSDPWNCLCWWFICVYFDRPYFQEPGILCKCWHNCRAGKLFWPKKAWKLLIMSKRHIFVGWIVDFLYVL